MVCLLHRATATIKKKPQGKNITSASGTQGGHHKNCHRWLRRRRLQLYHISCTSVHGELLSEWVKYNQNLVIHSLIGSRPSDHYFRSVCWFVCLSVCLSVCFFLCRVFLSRLWSDFDQTWAYVICLGLVVFPRIYGLCDPAGGLVTPKTCILGVLGLKTLSPPTILIGLSWFLVML